MATVSLRSIHKSFNGNEVIKGVNLDIRDRELAVVVGPSGCGKSTLLRLIAGLEDAPIGEIWIDGEKVNDITPAKRGLAMVFQGYALYPHMTVAANMGFSLRLAGVGREEREEKVRAAARILQIESLLERKPRELSGGQRQRVAIGRAIVRNPKVFLFDEPLSNLDAALRVQMRAEFMKLHEELGWTMIYVTHDQVEAMTMADLIIVLNEGAVEQTGTPLELYHHPRNLFVAGFIGSPKMNFLPSKVMGAGAAGVKVAVAGVTELEIPVAPGYLRQSEEVCLGIRPEHLSLCDLGQLRAEVKLVERLGGTTFVRARLENGQELTIQAGGDDTVSVRDIVGIRVSGSGCHLFDKSGNVIPPARS